MKRTLTLMLILALAPLAWAQDEKPDQGVALTVYNGGYGVVREVRTLTIDENGKVQFTDVPTAIDATTVHFKSFTDPDAKLLEQNYQYDLVSADKLLQKYIDREIDVVAEGQIYSGTLMSFDAGQIVMKEDDSGSILMIRRGDHVRDIRFKSLPEGLLTQPTLVWLVAAEAGKHLCEVSYQTGGLNWHAEYVLVLNKDDTAADMTGWVSVENNSGKRYVDARLKFIAGDVRRVQPQPARIVKGRWEALRAGAAPGGPQMVEKAFFEYHMYTLQRPSTVASNEVKQLELFTPAKDVKVEKKFLYNPMGNFRWNWGGRYNQKSFGAGTESKKVNVFIEFGNEKENNLGIPLPAGKIRVYKQDPEDKAMEFIGEERIDHTPKDEDLSLLIGNAFDIVGERKQTDFATRPHWMREKIEIKVRNHKEEGVTVRIKEPLYRWSNWEITSESHEHEKLDSRNIAWDVEIPADGEVTLNYTVEYTW